MNYFLHLNGVSDTGMTVSTLLSYLYAIKNPTQHFDTHEIEMFEQVVEHPNTGFLRHVADKHILEKYSVKSIEPSSRKALVDLPRLVAGLHKVDRVLIIGSITNIDFDFIFKVYSMRKSTWDIVVRKKLIDNFLNESA